MITLRALIIRDTGLWSAQCLERDIGAASTKLHTCCQQLALTISAELAESMKRTGQPFRGIAPAPAKFTDLYDRCRVRLRPTGALSLEMVGEGIDLTIGVLDEEITEELGR